MKNSRFLPFMSGIAVGYWLTKVKRYRLNIPGLRVTSPSEVRDPLRPAHAVPAVPILLDGVRSAPDNVLRFQEQNLIYVWDSAAQAQGVVPVFTSVERVQEYFQRSSEAQSDEIGVSRQALSGSVCNGAVVLWANSNFSGSRWFFSQSWGNISNFTCVYPTWWWCTNINDEVESVENYAMSNFLALHEHINFMGDSLYVTCGIVSNLGLIGWGNRISSMSYVANIGDRV